MSFREILIITFCLLMPVLHAQPATQEIRILDFDNDLPIPGVSYQYGKQHGASDANGVIHFIRTEEKVMNLSHVNYGAWQLLAYKAVSEA